MNKGLLNIRESVTYPLLTVQSRKHLRLIFNNLGNKKSIMVSERLISIEVIISIIEDNVEKLVRCFDQENLDFIFSELELNIKGGRNEKQEFLINMIYDSISYESNQPLLYNFIDKNYLDFLRSYVSAREEYSKTLRDKHLWGDMLNEINNLSKHNPRYYFNVYTSWTPGDIHEVSAHLYPDKLMIHGSTQFNPIIEAIGGRSLEPFRQCTYYVDTKGKIRGEPKNIFFGSPEIQQRLSLKVG